MGSGALVEARGPAGPDSRFETSGPRVWFEVGPRGDITFHYGTLNPTGWILSPIDWRIGPVSSLHHTQGMGSRGHDDYPRWLRRWSEPWVGEEVSSAVSTNPSSTFGDVPFVGVSGVVAWPFTFLEI